MKSYRDFFEYIYLNPSDVRFYLISLVMKYFYIIIFSIFIFLVLCPVSYFYYQEQTLTNKNEALSHLQTQITSSKNKLNNLLLHQKDINILKEIENINEFLEKHSIEIEKNNFQGDINVLNLEISTTFHNFMLIIDYLIAQKIWKVSYLTLEKDDDLEFDNLKIILELTLM